MHVLDSRGEVWKLFIVMVPTMGAALIAVSRIMDARHHPFDVITGSMLGVLTAWGAYRQYFPPVTEAWKKGRAYPIRSWASVPLAPPSATVYHESQEPLRQSAFETATLDERPLSTGSSPPAGSGRNVFREQIHRSQREREREAPGQYGSGPYRSPRDGEEESSEEEEQEAGRSYEMRPRYTLTDPEGSIVNLGADGGGGDEVHTAYRSTLPSPGLPTPRSAGGTAIGTAHGLEDERDLGEGAHRV